MINHTLYFISLLKNDKSYMNWYSMSNKALCETIGAYIKHNRLSQNRKQDEVAEKAGLSRSTLSLLEKGETVTINTLIQTLRVLDLLYVLDNFQLKPQISPLELARLDQAKRKRASNKRSDQKPDSEW